MKEEWLQAAYNPYLWMKLINSSRTLLLEQVLPFFLSGNDDVLLIRAARILKNNGRAEEAIALISDIQHPLAAAELQGFIADQNTSEAFYRVIRDGVVKVFGGETSPLTMEATTRSYAVLAECYLYSGQLEMAKVHFHRAIGAAETLGLENVALRAEMQLVWFDFYHENYRDCMHNLRRLIPQAASGGHYFLLREMCRRYLWVCVMTGDEMHFVLPFLRSEDRINFEVFIRRMRGEEVDIEKEDTVCELTKVVRDMNLLTGIRDDNAMLYDKVRLQVQQGLNFDPPSRENENEFFLHAFTMAILQTYQGNFLEAMRIAEEEMSDGLICRTSTSRSLRNAVILNAMICRQENAHDCMRVAQRLMHSLLDVPRGVLSAVMELLSYLPQVLYYLNQSMTQVRSNGEVLRVINDKLFSDILLVEKTQAKFRGELVRDLFRDLPPEDRPSYPRTINKVFEDWANGNLDRANQAVDKTLKRHREVMKLLRPVQFVVTSFVDQCVPTKEGRVKR